MNTKQPEKGSDQREHARIPTAIVAKISVPGEDIIRDCLVVDLSAGGAGVQYTGTAPGAGMICHLTIRGFGVFDGITTRDYGALMGVRFLFGEAERCHLREKLIAFVKVGISNAGEFSQNNGSETFKIAFQRPNGELHKCEVRDISLQGVMLRTSVRPPIGELLILSRLYGRVARHNGDGIGIQFVSFVGSQASVSGGGLLCEGEAP